MLTRTPNTDVQAPTRAVDAFEIRADLLRRDAAKGHHVAPDVFGPLERSGIALRARAVSVARALETAWASSLAGIRDLWSRPAFTPPAIGGIGRSLRRIAMPIVDSLLVASRRFALEAVGTIRRIPGGIQRPQRAVREFVVERAQIQHVPSAQPLAVVAEVEPPNEDLARAESRLAAKQNTLGYYHPDVAAELHLIGAMHHDAGRYTEAVAFYGAALAIRERLDPDHPELAAVLEDLAAARQDEGESAESEALIARANQIRQARRSSVSASPGETVTRIKPDNGS